MHAFPRPPAAVCNPATILAYDIETIAPSMPDGSFPPWPTHRPVAIGFATALCRGGDWAFDISALVLGAESDEADLIRAADQRMATAEIVTGYNSAQFDALVLRLAAQRCRLWDLKPLADHAAAHRYGGSHADLADLYASYGRKVSLAAIAEQVGIPVKTDIAGGDVAALWEAGEHERVRRYVMEDAVATLCLYLAWAASRSANEALVTRAMAALARHIEATPDLHHLHAFVDCSLMRWCRPRALKADVSAALKRITNRLRVEKMNAPSPPDPVISPSTPSRPGHPRDGPVAFISRNLHDHRYRCPRHRLDPSASIRRSSRADFARRRCHADLSLSLRQRGVRSGGAQHYRD